MKYDLKALLKSSEASLTQIVDILNTIYYNSAISFR